MTQYNLPYHLRDGFRSIFTHGLMSVAAVCMILACLIIMGSFSLVAVNIDNTLGRYEEENEFIAYIDESLTEEEAKALQPKLEAVSNVATVTFMTRDEALERYTERYTESENRAIFESLTGSVLRHRFRVHVTELENMAATVKKAEGVAGVADIRWDQAISDGFVALRNVASAVAVILIVMLALISLFIIANTTKLATFHRREEIAIMKMCGATNWFIRWPFIFEGMLLGLMGAVLAFFLQWGIYAVIVQAIDGFGGLQLVAIIPFKTLWVKVMGAFCVTGLVIGAGGSLLAIRKFLQV